MAIVPHEPEFVAKEFHSIRSRIKAGKVIEIESEKLECLNIDTLFSLFHKVPKNPVVLPQDVVDMPHVLPALFAEVVIVGTPALIGAEFFVNAAMERNAALKTGSCISIYHITQRV
jgi:hypothetical protein